ncbi:phosphatase PAP2 family protein [Phenylobacterium sp.]|uniref:phosphatase PAP2 family protein n=1 Tax=Phenylobacterium sp. TaxID=1871053 RepID=UPI002F423938
MHPLSVLLAAALASAAATSAFADAATFLSPVELDAGRFLPPPPAEGSPPALAEVAELHAIEAARSPGALAHAKSDDVTKDASIFAAVMGPGFDLKALPATARLMSDVRHDEKVAADAAKAHFGRKRPWIVDPTFRSCTREDEPLTSYPSGHATMGFSMAVVLADLAPDKAPALLARAEDYAESRMVCGMHFRADIVAGQVLGTAVGQDLLHSPAFRADRAAAAAELRAARLAP